MSARVVVSFLVLILIAWPVRSEEAESTATVLCYHVVGSPDDGELSITREAFRQQMQYLATTGYTVIPLAEVASYLEGRQKKLPANAVVITVDDGYRSTYSEIFPVVKQHGFPFTAFIYPKWVGQSSNALTWDQVKEMADDNVDIQSHTLSHAYLTRRRGGYAGAYPNWVRLELEESKRIIEQQTGRPVRFLAYPYGDYDSQVAAYASQSGYDAALTCDFGSVKKGSNLFRMKRVVIRKDTSFGEFRALLGNAPLKLQEQSPTVGSLFSEEVPVISARIPDYKRLDPTSVQMAVLSLGRAPFSYDARDGSISLIVRDTLKGRTQRAFVWGTERGTGKRVEATWTFYVAAEEPPAETLAQKRPPAASAVAAGVTDPKASEDDTRLVVRTRRR